jgi:hypothetical protein
VVVSAALVHRKCTYAIEINKSWGLGKSAKSVRSRTSLLLSLRLVDWKPFTATENNNSCIFYLRISMYSKAKQITERLLLLLCRSVTVRSIPNSNLYNTSMWILSFSGKLRMTCRSSSSIHALISRS